MHYWKGLLVAAAIDLVWLTGCPGVATEPTGMGLDPVDVVVDLPLRRASDPRLGDLNEAGYAEDSLMAYLHAHPADVAAMAQLAELYAGHGWDEAAIGPLARALQLDPARRGLWSALDRALKRSGRAHVTDAELTRAAAQFVETVQMWGGGC